MFLNDRFKKKNNRIKLGSLSFFFKQSYKKRSLIVFIKMVVFENDQKRKDKRSFFDRFQKCIKTLNLYHTPYIINKYIPAKITRKR